MTVGVIFTEIDARQALFRHSGISTRNILPALKKNDVYRATSGQLIPGAGKLSFRELAKAAGYHHVYEFDKLEDLESSIETITDKTGPTFVYLKVQPLTERSVFPCPRLRKAAFKFKSTKFFPD